MAGVFLAMIRTVFRVPAPVVDKARAVEIAIEAAMIDGVILQDDPLESLRREHPPRVSEGLRTWTVRVNPVVQSPWYVICNQTGVVVKSGIPPL